MLKPTKTSTRPSKVAPKSNKSFKCINCNKTLCQHVDLTEGSTVSFGCPRCKSVLKISKGKVVLT